MHILLTLPSLYCLWESCSISTLQPWNVKGSLLHDSFIVSLKNLNGHYWTIKLVTVYKGRCQMVMFKATFFQHLPWLIFCSPALLNSNSQNILIKRLIIYVLRRLFCRLYASFRKLLIRIFSVTSGKIWVIYGGRVSVYLLWWQCFL